MLAMLLPFTWLPAVLPVKEDGLLGMFESSCSGGARLLKQCPLWCTCPLQDGCPRMGPTFGELLLPLPPPRRSGYLLTNACPAAPQIRLLCTAHAKPTARLAISIPGLAHFSQPRPTHTQPPPAGAMFISGIKAAHVVLHSLRR